MKTLVKVLNNAIQVVFARLSLGALFGKLPLPSTLVLIVVNLIPVAGVFVLNWNPFDLIILYWLENVVIGVFNLFKILLAEGRGAFAKQIPVDHIANSRLFNNVAAAGFFAVHYGVFTLVHGVMVLAFFGGESTFLSQGNYLILLLSFPLGIILSHGFSFAYNFVWKNEYKFFSPQHYFALPYKRVIPIHVFIIIGGMIFSSGALPFSELVAVIFATIKIVFDLFGHFQEHKQDLVSD